jgi:uncharacterized protein YjbI with pentapeptide repeats
MTTTTTTPFTPTPEQLAEIVRLNADYWYGRPGGRRANLRGANLGGANLRGANLGGANLRGADLGGANLGDANLRGANLGGANLGGANLGDANLRGANLGGANLRGADLGGANLRGADLRGANLGGANLRGADLGDANLGGANLRGANLGGANLRGADLGGADLGGADLGDANLGGANLRGADLGDDTVLPDGVVWNAYVADLVPALLTAGGKRLEDVATEAVWGCHRWGSDGEALGCPIATAFNVHALSAVPVLYRAQANQFIQFFDAGLVPRPESAPAPIQTEGR